MSTPTPSKGFEALTVVSGLGNSKKPEVIGTADAVPLVPVAEELAFAVKCAVGDRTQRDELFERFWSIVKPIVVRHVVRWLRAYPDDVDDVTVLIRARIYDKLHLYEPKQGSSIVTWVYVVARNVALNWIKGAPRFVYESSLDQSSSEKIFGTSASVHDEYVVAELAGLLREAVEKLPESERRVVQLMDFDAYSVREISDLLGISESNVKVTHYRAKRRLETILKSTGILEK